VNPDVFAMKPIGVVRSPYTATAQIPKGLGTTHEAEGVLEILPALEPGLTDIEGFSHLYVLWVFHRARAMSSSARRPPIRVPTASSPRAPLVGLTPTV